jgi:tyrosinase
MKSWLPFTYLVSLLVLLLGPSSLDAQCARTNVRREIRQLSPAQLSRYLNAVNQLNTGPWPTPYDQMVWRHISTAPENHGFPPFFPWHRVFLGNYETLLQRIDPSITVPYWDFTIDARAPHQSPIFRNNYFGGRGTGPNCRLLVGPFANRVCYYSSNPAFGPHYLRRCFNRGANGISPLYSPEVMSNILRNSNDYNQLRNNVESAPHGTAHVGIGGSQGDMSVMMSPCDPLFFSLHAYMDKVWDRWQRSRPERFRSYLGTNRNGSPARLTDRLASYTSWTVGATLDVSASPFCAVYSDDSEFHTSSLNALMGLRKRDEIKLEELEELETPEPLPDSYIAMMNLNRTMVRGVESTLKGFIHKCNSKIQLVKSAVEESVQAVANGSLDTIDKLQAQVGSTVDLKELTDTVTTELKQAADAGDISLGNLLSPAGKKTKGLPRGSIVDRYIAARKARKHRKKAAPQQPKKKTVQRPSK